MLSLWAKLGIQAKNCDICQLMSIRQEKFAGLIQQHLAEIFQKEASSFQNVFITISQVKVSPDLGHAKVYLSFLNYPKTQAQGKNELMDTINFHAKDLRHKLAQKVKNQVRVVPELQFFLDESLDYVFHMEDVFKRVHEQDNKNK